MRYIIGFLLAIGLLIFVFVLIFRGGGDNAAPQAQTKLIDYANSSVVMQYTVNGPVSADLTRDQIRVTIGSSESTMEVFQGYEGSLVRTRSYANNPTAYADFLAALDMAGYTLGNKDKKFADERGYCPNGNRYIMQIKDGERDIQRLWSTSCGGSSTFKGKASMIQTLFIRQIPDYSTLAGGVL